jgi:hypothetical protein
MSRVFCVRALGENRGELGAVGRPVGNVSNGNNTVKGGNNLDYTKLRLKRDRPDLYEREAMRRVFCVWSVGNDHRNDHGFQRTL